MATTQLEEEQRFWDKVRRAGGDNCWLWMGGTTNGYGMGRLHGKSVKAHRVSYELNIGPIPDNLCVCHHCDNTLCVRPDHLFVGTFKDNTQDAKNKGRLATGLKSGMNTQPHRRPRGDRNGSRQHPELLRRGSKHGMAKLSEVDVVNILREHKSGTGALGLSRRYGVARSTIEWIILGTTWKHIPRTGDS